MKRREFIQSLSVIPVVGMFLHESKRVTTPPYEKDVDARRIRIKTPCDVSFNSLQWAVNIGKENNFGRPLCLHISPENLFPAREILGVPGKKYTASSEVNVLYDYMLVYRVHREWRTYSLWELEFERGFVYSPEV
jgi:hypothetical protein